jgi:hypothetical protein
MMGLCCLTETLYTATFPMLWALYLSRSPKRKRVTQSGLADDHDDAVEAMMIQRRSDTPSNC